MTIFQCSHSSLLILITRNIQLYTKYFSDVNVNLFTNTIGNTNWEEILNKYDPKKSFEIFSDLYNNNFQKCFLLKKIKVNNKYSISPHITTGLEINIKEKHRLEKLAAKWPLTYKSRYKTYRNNCGIWWNSPKILHLTEQYISIPFTHIINLYIKQGCFLDKLRIAKVIPIFKSGDKADENNYRPISNLPSISKIFEKVIAKRLNVFLESFNLLSNKQFGFRKNKSTETAILKLICKIYMKWKKVPCR